MVGIQTVSARIGRVTGQGLAANMRKVFPRWLCLAIAFLLLAANTINIAADIAAMGEALQLVVGGGKHGHGHAVIFGLSSLLLQVFIPYQQYIKILKWLTLSLLVYVAVALMAYIPWTEVLVHALLPHITISAEYATIVVALFGTTISPYLFFWQASQEVEDIRNEHHAEPLLHAPKNAHTQLRPIKFDTYIGMGFSNLVAFFIMLSTAATLHVAGVTNIETSAQAAEALRPIAGNITFLIFSLGIIGTGMLAVPVLAGSAAYAVAECFDWREGLDKKLIEAKEFYAIIIVATIAGVLLDFTPIDPIKILFWSAVINGAIAVPIMAIMMIMAVRPDIKGDFVIKKKLWLLGWVATALMLATIITMILFW